jgi:hypothetical protein
MSGYKAWRNFREIVIGEVLRISIPRTQVNKGKKIQGPRLFERASALLVTSSVLSYASLRTFLDLSYLIGPQTVGLHVNGVRLFRTRSFNEAKDLSPILVEPVPYVVYPVLLLGFEVLHVGVGYGLFGETLDVFVVV